MKPLFFDTETTGFPLKNNSELTHPDQPHLLQLGIRLDNGEKELKAQINILVDNGDIIVPDAAFNVHGISSEIAQSHGITLTAALRTFHSLIEKADVIIAHNLAFDLKILRIGYARINQLNLFTEKVLTKASFCTMEAATNICKIPISYGNGSSYKWPTLDESYRTLVNEEGFIGAHDAMVDVNACRDVFYALKQDI
jgi:DNA polymerase III subunit epsilon